MQICEHAQRKYKQKMMDKTSEIDSDFETESTEGEVSIEDNFN
jgi:hypothetical protein